jgi:uncharacterized protein with PhoU and TrkA domain
MDNALELRQLERFADAIRKEMQVCLSLGRKTVEHAKRIGELLIEAKQMLPHGAWEQWLATNFLGKPYPSD